MKGIVINLPFPKQWRTIGITLFPFIFINKKFKNKPYLINHENIHIQQQLEWLILPFYLVYIGHFLYNFLILKMNYNRSYINICFEKEAYSNECKFEYLSNTPFKFFRKGW